MNTRDVIFVGIKTVERPPWRVYRWQLCLLQLSCRFH